MKWRRRNSKITQRISHNKSFDSERKNTMSKSTKESSDATNDESSDKRTTENLKSSLKAV